MKYKVTATCEDGHKQEMFYSGMSREMVEVHAGLMDGTSPLYLKSPRADDPGVTRIGRCGFPYCGRLFKCEIEEVAE